MVLVDGMAVLSGLSFFVYGFSCLQSSTMAHEFERFGVANFRVLTGVLEMCGGAGLLIGLWYTPLLFFASAGLTVLMALGVGVRLRVRDNVLQTLPALGFCVVNGYVAVEAWQRVAS